MSSLPEKFIIPEDRLPKAWSQGVYDCCGLASVVKVLEVHNYKRTGVYTMLSKAYGYGKHTRPDKKQGGIDYAYTMESLLKHGSVPDEMFPTMNEVPDIISDVANHPNIKNLDKEAEKTRIKSYTKIVGNAKFYENVKKYLYEYKMPLVGNMVNKRHCTVIVGWDGNKLLYHDHNGKSTLYKGRFNEAYYFELYPLEEIAVNSDDIKESLKLDNIDNILPSINTPTKPITDIDSIVSELVSAGIITNIEMWLSKCESDINIYWLCRKMANKLRGTL